MLETITRGKKQNPRRTVIYGTHGIGKSTLAASWPNPVFVPTEDGIGDIDVAAFPLCTDLNMAYQAIKELGNGDHEFKTVVVDSVDWLERLIWKKVCSNEGKKAITDFGYGAGYGKANAIFSDIFAALNCCRNIGMNVVLIAHCTIARFENPEGDSYDRYVPKLHKDASALMQEWSDEVLFATYKVNVRKSDEGFNRERGVGVGAGERVLKTTERPAHLAKNRLSLPDELPMNYEAYAKFLQG